MMHFLILSGIVVLILLITAGAVGIALVRAVHADIDQHGRPTSSPRPVSSGGSGRAARPSGMRLRPSRLHLV